MCSGSCLIRKIRKYAPVNTPMKASTLERRIKGAARSANRKDKRVIRKSHFGGQYGQSSTYREGA